MLLVEIIRTKRNGKALSDEIAQAAMKAVRGASQITDEKPADAPMIIQRINA